MSSTHVVLPVPPTVRFPTLITRHGSRTCASHRRRYAASRRAMASPYGTAAARSAALIRRSETARGWLSVARRRQASWKVLHIVEDILRRRREGCQKRG